MDASGRPPISKRQISGASRRNTRWLMFLCGLLVLLLAITLQPFGSSHDNTAYGAPAIHLGATPTPTQTSVPSAPPTLTLAVPASGHGPIGAHITIIGSNWGTSDVLVGAAAPGASCDNPSSWAQTLNHVRPASNQGIIFTFDWPARLNSLNGAYSICAANDTGSASVSYQLLSASPPSLAVSPATTNAESVVTITGTNFLGSGNVTLTVTDAQNNTRELTTLAPDENGNVTVTFKPRATDVGDVTLRAFTSAPQGMRPALDTKAKLHVDAALTPTVAVTSTTDVAVTQPPSKGNGSTLALIVVVVAFVLLALLALGGTIFFFVMRNRNRPDGDAASASAYYGGSDPGYGRPGNIFGDAYQDSGYDSPTSYMDSAGWDSATQGGFPPDEPDPTWRPRPMTGQGYTPNDYSDVPYSNYGAGDSGRYPPQDPWGAPGDTYGRGRGGQSYGTSRGFGSSPRGGDGHPPSDPRNRGSGGGSGRGWPPDQPPENDW